MESYQHLLLSIILGTGLALYLLPLDPFAILAVAVVAGTLIDLDHFVIHRIESGSWEKLQVALKNPVEIIIDNESLMGEKWLEPGRVIPSHLLQLAVIIGIYGISGSVFLLIAVASVALHIICDIFWDYSKGYIGV